MSEYTANAGHDKGPAICVGMMYPDKEGELTMPPEYSYKIEFDGNKDCLVIPLEGSKEKKATRARKTTATKTTKTKGEGMTH